MNHTQMLREYTKLYKNLASTSAQLRLAELDTLAAREGLRFRLVNETQWMMPHYAGDPRFELVQA